MDRAATTSRKDRPIQDFFLTYGCASLSCTTEGAIVDVGLPCLPSRSRMTWRLRSRSSGTSLRGRMSITTGSAARTGSEREAFDADIREGGHLTCRFRIGGGGPILRRSVPAPRQARGMSMAVEISYDDRLAIFRPSCGSPSCPKPLGCRVHPYRRQSAFPEAATPRPNSTGTSSSGGTPRCCAGVAGRLARSRACNP